MLLVPDFLYGLTAKDLAGQTLSYHHEHRFVTLAQAQIDLFTSTVPGDRVWVVTHVAYRADGGGAQTADSLKITETDETTNDLGLVRAETVGSGIVEINLTLLGYLVRPGNRLRINSFFSAGALTNEVQFSIAGFQIPRGTIQLVG